MIFEAWMLDSMKLIVSRHKDCPLTPSPALRGGGWGGGATRGLPMRLSPTPTLPREEREREHSIASVEIIRTSETLTRMPV